MGLIEIKCNSCGSELEMNINKLMAVCPYCGTKMMYDSDSVMKMMETAIVEREKTKRTKIEEETKRMIYEDEMEFKYEKQQQDVLIKGALILAITAVALFWCIAKIG